MSLLPTTHSYLPFFFLLFFTFALSLSSDMAVVETREFPFSLNIRHFYLFTLICYHLNYTYTQTHNTYKIKKKYFIWLVRSVCCRNVENVLSISFDSIFIHFRFVVSFSLNKQTKIYVTCFTIQHAHRNCKSR